MSYTSVTKGLSGSTPIPLKVDVSGNLSTTLNSIVSLYNNYTGSFTSGQNWTGSGELNTYTDVMVVLKTDATGSLYMDFSPDGTSWDSSLQFDIGINSPEFHIAVKGPRFFRARYLNGTTVPSFFRLYSYFGQFRQGNLPLNATIRSDADASLVRAVLTGKDFAGNFRNSEMDYEGHLKVNIDEPLTAFNELSTAQSFPVAQVDFVYGLNSQIVTTSSLVGGTISSSAGHVIVTTSGSNGSNAMIQSNRYVKYRPGQGVLGRFTAIFTTGSVNTAQYAGLSTSTLLNMVTFGTSGSSFGIWHKSSGSFSTFISQSDWSSDKMDGSAGFYNPSGMNLDITKGNVYQIKYQYLGYGNLYFYIENKDTGDFQLVHQIKYPNSNTVPSFRNPSLNLVWAAENFANGTEPKVVMGSSGALFIEGLRRLLGPRNSFDNNKNLAMTSSTAVFTLRNATNFNGIHNRAQISFGTLSIASDMANINSGMQVLQIWKNVTLNTSSFRPINGTSTDAGVSINGESVISYDTTGSVVTSGSSSYVLFNQSISRNSNSSIDLSDSDIYMAPGDTLVFLVKTLGTSGQTSSVSVNWTEDI